MSEAIGRVHSAVNSWNAPIHDELMAGGIKHVFYVSQGTSHEWQTWRRDLNDFAPRLFRDGAK